MLIVVDVVVVVQVQAVVQVAARCAAAQVRTQFIILPPGCLLERGDLGVA
jgi:hypothetical protein